MAAARPGSSSESSSSVEFFSIDEEDESEIRLCLACLQTPI